MSEWKCVFGWFVAYLVGLCLTTLGVWGLLNWTFYTGYMSLYHGQLSCLITVITAAISLIISNGVIVYRTNNPIEYILRICASILGAFGIVASIWLIIAHWGFTPFASMPFCAGIGFWIFSISEKNIFSSKIKVK